MAIAVQSRLQPDNQELLEAKLLFNESIQNADWNEMGLKWLVNLMLYNPKRVRAFHQEYYHLYES